MTNWLLRVGFGKPASSSGRDKKGVPGRWGRTNKKPPTRKNQSQSPETN